ncbi:SGNH/GDSL hydrolase family protein [Legionella spiritensis]|uniref:Putative thermolabile hemolysin n=1 Tax=Legionella spiritensis TaxID=452 RepID=A0A0W0Z8W9_LEGSP|nr:SGNH/GDSL hydrolase family protein [Legionella spiritensis]KTD65471.1 putative thermolabile hemolysin [Legionella spiritensis]SNV35811.1 thermolabile hemolysin [Legionella spiritensis]
MTKPKSMTHVVVLGDSLSDKGTMDRRKLFGLIPMSYFSGLSSKSPRGRFTNGFLWGDFIAAGMAEQFLIDRTRRKAHLKRNARDNADLADKILDDERGIRERNEEAFSLDDDGHVFFEGHQYARFYCEGGLTAHDYSGEFTFDLSKEGAREIVATLEKKRELLLNDDEKYDVSEQEKNDTLVIEWSGANDLITVNERPTNEEADKAVAERIKNIEQLIEHGYRNFVLFNLPDLSLTPRYQRQDEIEQQNAQVVSKHFNEQLAKKCRALQEKYKDASPPVFLDVFDVSSLLTQVYDNPEEYGFEKGKLTQPYTESEEFSEHWADPVDRKEHISPSEGYMFWDDVHPTADMHTWLGEKFKEQYSKTFKFEAWASRHATEQQHQRNKTEKQLAYLNIDVPESQYPLPKDVGDILQKLKTHAASMKTSRKTGRVKKGSILLAFVAHIKKQNGDMQDIKEEIENFKKDHELYNIVKKHNHPVYDFFRSKTTTRSEDYIEQLLSTVQEHIEHDRPKELLFSKFN